MVDRYQELSEDIAQPSVIADAARYQLVVLTAEVQNENKLMSHVCHTSLFLTFCALI